MNSEFWILSTKVHKYTSPQVHKYTSTQVYKYTSIQVYKYTSIQVYKYTSIQVQNHKPPTLHSRFTTYDSRLPDKTIKKIEIIVHRIY